MATTTTTTTSTMTMIDSNALRLCALLMFSPSDLPMNEYDR
jgi:hypothetical protein